MRLAAQVETRTAISGTVTDPSASVIAGAAVTVKNQGTGATWETATNTAGFYAFPSLPPGTYTVTVALPGFKTAVRTDQLAQVAQSPRVDIKLEIGEINETLSVSAAGTEISTTTAAISGDISPKLVQSLPLNTRNVFTLAALTPGAVPQNLMQWGGGNSQVSFSQTANNYVPVAGSFVSSGVFAGGNRDSASNVSVDGINVQNALYGQSTQLQSISSVEEVRIQSGSMNAEFGNGATAVNIITKGGTNQFHGEVFEFLRNDNLDANDFFTNLNGRDLPEYKQNQFGATLGGPILRDKFHFLANYDGMRASQSTVSDAQVPTADLRQGDFSSYRPPLPGGGFGPTPTIHNPYRYDPVTGLRESFPGNRIPLGPTNLCTPRPTCVDPVTLGMLEFTPLPNTIIDGIPRFSGTPASTINDNQYTVRLDWHKSTRTDIYGRYTSQERKPVQGGLMPLQGLQNPFRSKNVAIHWTEVFSPQLTRQAHRGYG